MNWKIASLEEIHDLLFCFHSKYGANFKDVRAELRKEVQKSNYSGLGVFAH